MGVGWSQIDEEIKEQVYASDYFVGGAYESEIQAGKTSLRALLQQAVPILHLSDMSLESLVMTDAGKV